MPEWLMVILLAVALGTDAFSLAVGMGIGNLISNSILKMAGTVGVFHVVMPLAGMFVGNLLGGLIGKVAVLIGGGVLVLLGGRMIMEGLPWRRSVMSFREAKKLLGAPLARPPIRWGGLLTMGWSVSVDAFGVGVGLGTSTHGPPYLVLVIGAVAAMMTGAGLALGRFLGRWAGSWAELLGGMVLAGIGFKLLLGL